MVRPRFRLVCWSILSMLLAGPMVAPAVAGFFDDVGYTELLSELGPALPTGQGVGVTQVEASSGGSYAPDLEGDAFIGKTFYLMSGDSNVSAHANSIAKQIYGNVQSMAPGVTEIDLWNAPLWLQSGFLKTSAVEPPDVERRQVQNHSWIGSMSSRSATIDALRRLDYAIVRDGFTAVVGMDNGDSTTLPDLLGQSYNTISVGRTDGNHSHGDTLFDGTGRSKPDLVAPSPTTSSATARVSSAAALLIDAADGSDAGRPEAVKAILLSGATKDEFDGNWARTSTRPLDEVYGAGELNIDRGYHIFASGRQSGGDGSTVPIRGWDYRQTVSDGVRYFFDVPAGQMLSEWSAVLTWNRIITDDDRIGFSPVSSLANLDLALYRAEAFTVTQRLDVSASSGNNIEHIYANNRLGLGSNLGPGRYALEVRRQSAEEIGYALAWYGELGPLLGDMNLSGLLDYDDIGPFTTAVADPSAYEERYGVSASARGDMNANGLFDFDDIMAFMEHLQLLAVAASLESVPEPSTWTLACLLILSLGTRRTAIPLDGCSADGRPS
ncbi:MAG: S8 family serine peptidase [Pirellulales bacterium]